MPEDDDEDPYFEKLSMFLIPQCLKPTRQRQSEEKRSCELPSSSTSEVGRDTGSQVHRHIENHQQIAQFTMHLWATAMVVATTTILASAVDPGVILGLSNPGLDYARSVLVSLKPACCVIESCALAIDFADDRCANDAPHVQLLHSRSWISRVA